MKLTNCEYDNFEKLQERMGYQFRDPSLLYEALTHSSYAHEYKGNPAISCNERLEFLGDSVLSLITSNHIYKKFPKEAEGSLSRLRAFVVRDTALADYARSLRVGQALLLGHGEDTPEGRDKKSTLENAFEALVAAIFLDGGYNEAERFVLPFIRDKVDAALSKGETRDYKTILQQIVQQCHGDRLEYVLVSEYGPDHDKTYEMEARLNRNVIGKGSGHSKKQAEQSAAADALHWFGDPTPNGKA
ncbi:MAG: ribonuclease III [Ruminococcaceae bacterium]|nr:ribonuclease III [Oscillospiraceae bacterium]